MTEAQSDQLRTMADPRPKTGNLPDLFDPRDRPLYLTHDVAGSDDQESPVPKAGPATGTSTATSAATNTGVATAAKPATNMVVSLRDNCLSVYNQGDLGSCTANAVAAALRDAY